MENEKTILSALKKNWIIYVPQTQISEDSDPQYDIVSQLAKNNPKNIKTIKIIENYNVLMIKKDDKAISKVLKLNKSQIKKLVAVYMMSDGRLVVDFTPMEEFLKKFFKIVEDGVEKERENMAMYR